MNEAFSCRMFYAPSAAFIDEAARLGLNCCVVSSSGHRWHRGVDEEDPPVYMPGHPKLRPYRQPRRRIIERTRRHVAGLIRRARRAGMKVIYHTYEPSMPMGFDRAYPECWSPEIREYRQRASSVRRNRNLCIAQAEVREALIEKVAEICSTFPEIDGFMFTNNETTSATKVWHRCDRCRDIPFARMMKLLHDTMLAGIERSGLTHIKLLNRCWGTHDHPVHYYRKFVELLELEDNERDEPTPWLRAWVECFRPAHLHFQPDRDIPAYLKLLDRPQTAFVYKASWADTNLHHPLNPWIGRYRGHEQVCELSFEFCRDAPAGFYIMGREMQRRARLCRRKGVDGLCGVPVCWGFHDKSYDSHAFDPAHWSLASLNIDLFAALCHDPDADLLRVTRRYLQRRYGQPLPVELAAMLLDTEGVAAGAMNIRGARATGSTFRAIYASLVRYAVMRRDWKRLIAPTPANLRRVERDKANVLARTRQMLQRIDALRPRIPPQAYDEFRLCFEHLAHWTNQRVQIHRAFMTAYALRQGALQPSVGSLDRLFTALLASASPAANVAFT